MARLEGTGKDPLGRYGKGEIFDVPDTESLYQELQDKGWAKAVKPEDDPGRTVTQIADSMVRNEPLVHPVEQKIAEKIGDDALAIVQQGDPDAKLKGLGRAEDAAPDSARQVTPEAVTDASVSNTVAGERARKAAVERAEAADKESGE